jgi:hypothetical protein
LLIGKARNYKDGVSYGQIAVNGTPGNTQRDLERLCEIEVGHERSEPNPDNTKTDRSQTSFGGPEANEKKPRTL